MLDRSSGLFVVGTMLFFFSGASCCLGFGGKTLTDPTRPPAYTVGKPVQDGKKAQKWRLTSTIIGPQRRVAVINNQVVQVGQKIDGAVLVGVETGGALLEKAGRKIHLTLKVTTVKYSVGTTP